MDESSPLTIFPKTHIKPFDGMAVTAESWALSHDEHRAAQRAHNLSFHGSGIVSGLEVVANDPPDHYVFISPGVAVDPVGNIIVIEESVAYDFGNAVEGQLFLVLGHGERESGGVETDTKLVHDEFVVAARPTLPKRPVVELARITIKSGQNIQNADEELHPAAGELDLRFRSQLTSPAPRLVSLGLCNIGGPTSKDVLAGWDYLTREARNSNLCKLVVEADIAAGADLTRFDVVCLTASEAFASDGDLAKSLKGYLDAGKILLAEALKPDANASFLALFEKLGQKLKPLAASDELLSTPYLFPGAPAGSNGDQVQKGKQVIYSSAGYQTAWAGKGTKTRADIRAAHEWGLNLLSASLNRPG